MSKQTWSAARLAGWAMALTPADLSADVQSRVEDCILDAIGCAIAGLDAPGTLASATVAANQYRDGKAPVWFRDTSLNAIGAAFSNAGATSILDIDDGHRKAMGHPGAAVIPTALGLAAETGASGPEIIAAIAAGYEVAVRIGAAELRKPYHTGNWSSFGAAITAARLCGLSAEQATHALAVTAYYGPRLTDLTQSNDMGAHVKESIPWSVVTGMSACDLAAQGFTGCRDALDLEGRFDPAVITKDLGQDLQILGTYFKKYSICRWIHTAVQALTEIMQVNGLAAADIKQITVETFEQAAALNNSTDPDTMEGAQYSVPYSLGVAAALGDVALSPMRPSSLHHALSIDIAKRVVIKHTVEMDGYLPRRVPVRLKVDVGSAVFDAFVVDAWGDAGSETTRDDLRGKFLHLAEARMSTAEARKIIAAVDGIADGGAGELLGLLSVPLAPAGQRAA